MGVVETWAWLKFSLATFLKRSNFSGNFEQPVDRASSQGRIFGWGLSRMWPRGVLKRVWTLRVCVGPVQPKNVKLYNEQLSTSGFIRSICAVTLNTYRLTGTLVPLLRNQGRICRGEGEAAVYSALFQGRQEVPFLLSSFSKLISVSISPIL